MNVLHFVDSFISWWTFGYFQLLVIKNKAAIGIPVAQTVNNLPSEQEARIQSLGQEDPLEKGMSIHSSILAWRIRRTEEPGGLQSVES